MPLARVPLQAIMQPGILLERMLPWMSLQFLHRRRRKHQGGSSGTQIVKTGASGAISSTTPVFPNWELFNLRDDHEKGPYRPQKGPSTFCPGRRIIYPGRAHGPRVQMD
jgi:hypothetical protein